MASSFYGIHFNQSQASLIKVSMSEKNKMSLRLSATQGLMTILKNKLLPIYNAFLDPGLRLQWVFPVAMRL